MLLLRRASASPRRSQTVARDASHPAWNPFHLPVSPGVEFLALEGDPQRPRPGKPPQPPPISAPFCSSRELQLGVWGREAPRPLPSMGATCERLEGRSGKVLRAELGHPPGSDSGQGILGTPPHANYSTTKAQLYPIRAHCFLAPPGPCSQGIATHFTG